MRKQTLFLVILVALVAMLVLGGSSVSSLSKTKIDITKYNLYDISEGYGFLNASQNKNHDLRFDIVLKNARPNKTYQMNLFENPAEPVRRYPGHAHRGIWESIGTFTTDDEGNWATADIWISASRLQRVLEPGSYTGHIDIIGHDPGPAFPGYFTANEIPFTVP